MEQKQKPKFLNLLQIHLPVTGVASIAHRVSGVVLVISIPFLIYWFDRSLHSADDFQALQQFLGQLWVKLLGTVAIWALAHHILSGIRFLLLDLDVGGGLRTARGSAWVVNIGAVVLLVLIGAGVWL